MKLDADGTASGARDGAAPSLRSAAPARIRVLVPDLPDANALLPWLARIDAARWYTNRGPLVEHFESALARAIAPRGERPFCVTTSSGTTALEMALEALQLAPGSRVLVPAYTFPATANAIVRIGHVPVLADVCRQRFTLTPAMATGIVRRHRVDAVMPVAALGAPLPVDDWDTFAREQRMPVLVDAAAALPLVAPTAHVHVACSLHATKPLGIGEGGLVVTHDGTLADRVRCATNHGFSAGLVNAAGTNGRMSEYAAAVGLAQLERFAEVRERRRRLWRMYAEALAGLDGVHLQSGLGDEAPAVLVVTSPAPASSAARALDERSIETRRWYCPPLHGHPAYASAVRAGNDASGALPNADFLAHHAIGLPFHTRLTDDDVARVVEALRSALE